MEITPLEDVLRSLEQLAQSHESPEGKVLYLSKAIAILTGERHQAVYKRYLHGAWGCGSEGWQYFRFVTKDSAWNSSGEFHRLCRELQMPLVH